MAPTNTTEKGFAHSTDAISLARFLGWFSIGLGLAETFAPRAVGQFIGTPGRDGIIQAYGLREIATGVGILTQPDPTEGILARVAGDALDLLSLGAALGSDVQDRNRVYGAMAMVAGVTALDIYCADALMKERAAGGLVPRQHSVPLDPSARADDPERDSERGDFTHEVAHDLAYKRLGMVNIAFYGEPSAGDRNWVLIDAGLPGTANRIVQAAEERFGKDARPAAIILTHGHVDHVGALQALAERWDVPIYAHRLERPYLDGSAAYPPPDPTVGNGTMPALSPLFPRGPFDFSRWLHDLPGDGTVPEMPGWNWLHTPGHTPGHISLWRQADRTIIAGDAFITTNQESAYAVAIQKPEMHGPPMYFTPDWASARLSVERLAALEPELAVTGHGRAMRGTEMRAALHSLARDFDRIAVPERGRYVLEPALAHDGSAYIGV